MGHEVMRGSSGVAVLHNGVVGGLLAGGSAAMLHRGEPSSQIKKRKLIDRC
jgi:hypothetical protein